MDTWTFAYDTFDPAHERLRETLCATGNGVFVTRGAAPEADADDHHYPGTYVGGLYNRLPSTVGDREIVNEDLVNAPNWLVLKFRWDDGEWIDLQDVEVLEHRQWLDMKRAVLHRDVRLRDDAGRTLRVQQRRFAHMASPHLAALSTTFTAEEGGGRLVVRSALDGDVINAGVPRYRALASDHLEVLATEPLADGAVRLEVQTTQSRVRVALAQRTVVTAGTEQSRVTHQDGGVIGHDLTIEVGDEPVTVEKVVALATSRDPAIASATTEVANALARAGSFDELLPAHEVAWAHLWNRFDLELADHSDRAQTILRLHLYHLLCTVSENTTERDVGVPARGLHGEAYRGHIFWDELFILPVVIHRIPVLARSLILYRHRRLPAARQAARAHGYRGAMFPWQSGSDGREESQLVHLNPESGRWIEDRSHRQRHVNHAIAYNVWQYYQATRDLAFLRFQGGELLIEIARFLASIATWSEEQERYEILGVMGPDEFHDGYPDAEEGGLDNNTYTNVFTAWVLARAVEVFEVLPGYYAEELGEKLGVSPTERATWEEISRSLKVVFHADGIPSQFEGYEELEEFDWEGYEREHGDIQRLDRILEAEGDTVNRYKASKQADVLMLFYLFSPIEIEDLFDRLGYRLDREVMQRTIEYYQARTSHGSTLSQITHSWVLARADRHRSWSLFSHALEADVVDVQGGTTEEGVHLGAMAGTVDLIQRAYTGLELRADALHVDPALPEELNRLRFELHYRGQRIKLDITKQRLVVSSRTSPVGPVRLVVRGEQVELAAGDRREFGLT